MRPAVRTPAHQTDRLAELVCSNSFKSIELANAHGLLKAELRALGQPAARRAPTLARVPGGTALAVDREVFSAGGARAGDGASRTSRSCARKCAELPSPGVVATGPLTSRPAHRGDRRPARARRRSRSTTPSRRSCRRDSLDHERLYALSRYGKGEGDDYLNAPMDAAGVRARSSTRCSRPTSTRATSSTRCRTSRAACRSRRWPAAAARRCASAR